MNREHIASLELNDYLDLLKSNYDNPNTSNKSKQQQKWPERATPYSREWIPDDENDQKPYSYNSKKERLTRNESQQHLSYNERNRGLR